MQNAFGRIQFSKRGNRNGICRIVYDKPRSHGIMQPGDLTTQPPPQAQAPQQNLIQTPDAYSLQKTKQI
jgi:hypothetical protein